MKRKTINAIIGIAVLAAYGGNVQAHTFGAEGAGFAEGFVHPFMGIDHLLTMLTVGIWAAQLGHRAVWCMPLAFVGTMCLAALSAFYIEALPALESMIAVTVLLSGLLLLFAVKLPIYIALMIAGSFAVAHGYAHGLEMPQTASPLIYGAGFVSATTLLHLLGITIATLAKRRLWLTRTGGFAIATAGVYLSAISV